MLETSQQPNSVVSLPLIPKSRSSMPVLTPAEAELVLVDAARRATSKVHKPTLIVPVLPKSLIKDEVETDRAHDRQRAESIERLIAAARVPPRYKDATLTDQLAVPEDASGAYLAAVRSVERLLYYPGIIAMLGARGIGKTWIACGLVLDFCRVVRSSRYLHVMDYFIGLKETYGAGAKRTEAGYEQDHLRPELLVLDEMHERADTAWEDRMLTRLIVKRHELERATLLLSNDSAETFKIRVGDSVTSRMKDDVGGIVVCSWASLRGRMK